MRPLVAIALAWLAFAGGSIAGVVAHAQVPVPVTPFGHVAARGPVRLVADQVEYDRKRDLYVAKGHVRITQGKRSLSADWASFSNTTRIGVASGNVVIREDGDTLRAQFVQFDVDTLTGVVYEGKLEAAGSQFQMQGREVRKTGKETYSFQHGRFTTCRCPNPKSRDPWAITAGRANLAVGGYGTARNTTLEVLGVPVIWFPWMIYPLKTERQTGFLFPRFGATSRTGGDIGIPFFWAAAPNVNVILTPSYLFKRGFKPSVGLEYVFGKRSHGRFFASYIHDQYIDPGSAATPFGRDRWAVLWRHDQYLPDDWNLKIDAKAISDNLYPFDFQDLGRYRSDRFLESTGFATHHSGESGGLGFVGSVDVARDLANPNDTARTAFLLQRLPDLNLESLPGNLSHPFGLVPSFGIDYTDFRPFEPATNKLPTAPVVNRLFLDTGINGIPDSLERNAAGLRGTPDGSLDNAPLGTENDGRFEEGEPLVDLGHRVTLTPNLAYPFRVADRIQVLPQLGYYGTLYDSRERGFKQRSLVTGRVDVTTEFQRRLTLPFGGGVVVHRLEPRIGWAAVSSVFQGNNPLFVPPTALPQQRLRELALDNVTLDPSDRVPGTDLLVFGFGNRFFRPGKGVKPARLWGDLSLLGEYRFSGHNLGLVVLQGDAYPFAGARTRVQVGYDPETSQLTEGLVEFGWSSPAGHEAYLGYRYLRNIPHFFENFPFDERYAGVNTAFDHINQFSASVRAALTSNWALTYSGSFSLEQTLALQNEAGVEYTSHCKCWALRVSVRDDRILGPSFHVDYTLLGFGANTNRPFAKRAGSLDALGGV